VPALRQGCASLADRMTVSQHTSLQSTRAGGHGWAISREQRVLQQVVFAPGDGTRRRRHRHGTRINLDLDHLRVHLEHASATVTTPATAVLTAAAATLAAAATAAWPLYTEFPSFEGRESYCSDPSVMVNNAAGGRTPPRFYHGGRTPPHFYYTDRYIPVFHGYIDIGETEMEQQNLWMYLSTTTPSYTGLVYRPGRTIAFEDLTDALHFIGIDFFVLPHGARGFHKEQAMQRLTERLRGDFESLAFVGHFDATKACDGNVCCSSGSKLHYEIVIVTLHGWNVPVCPGHQNLSYALHACRCEEPHAAC